MKKRILSGIQPTGEVHFGNYFGAIQNWTKLQESYECVFMVVDYHAITMPYDPVKLRENTWNLIFTLLALGVKPETLCIQSLIPEHTELGWILNCFSSYGELTRMTQFKDKSEQADFVSAGLFDYPVLQAADILIYKADAVPVGKDQEQHLELTRNIATRFNNLAKKEYFAMPEPLYTESPKIMSLADPTRKMSKSLGDKHYISVLEDPALVRKKVRSAVTDIGGKPTETMSEGVQSLFSLLKACQKHDQHSELLERYHAGGLQYSTLKDAVGEALAELTTQFRERRAEIVQDKKAIKEQIKASSAEIRKRAQQTLREVKELAGLLNY